MAEVKDLFSDRWLARFAEAWNSEPELTDALGRISFDATIGYGFKGEERPRGVVVVRDGRVVATLDWDMRAEPSTWQSWLDEPPGMMSVGMAYTTSKLQFVVGDYAAMIKDPHMAGPFMKSFAVMARV
ncbi:MAG: hypothetical protein ACK4MF_04625 [Hyphomicrobiaceae bacterium]